MVTQVDESEICLHSGKSSAIIEPSGMVNEFQECTARILIWQKPGLLGLFAVYFLQLPEKKQLYMYNLSVLRQEVARALFLCRERSSYEQSYFNG